VKRVQHCHVVLSKRLREAMDQRYPNSPNDTQKIAKLAKEAGVGRGTIQRILDPKTHGPRSTGIEKVEQLAKALRVELSWMLTDPDN
jgi:transcriptional regulator with XRE-family HTH domain